VKTVDEVLKEYADRNNVILEQDPMAAPPMDPAAAPPPPAPMAAPPPVAPAPEEEEEEPAKPTSKERMDLVQLALDALSIDPNDLEAPEKVVFKNEVNPENAKKKRKQIETIVTYHNGTGAEK
jgi:hypothetical protein